MCGGREVTSRKTWGNLHSSRSRWLCAPADTLAGPLSVWGHPRRMRAARVASTPPSHPLLSPGAESPRLERPGQILCCSAPRLSAYRRGHVADVGTGVTHVESSRTAQRTEG